MVMSAVTAAFPAKASALDSDMVKTAGKALIQKGIEKIPYVGSIASTLLGPTLNKLFGISETNELEEIEKKLDQIDKKLDDIQADLSNIGKSITELSGKLDSSTQAIMNSVYQAKFGMSLETFNTKLTSVAQITEQMYSEMDILYEDTISGEEVTSELYKTLRTAEMIKSFSSTTADEYVNMVLTLSKYLDGSQTASSGRGLFESAFLASCSNSVLGGEAATLVAPYINEVTGTLSAAYKLLIIVDTCKLYVAEHYSEITAAAKEGSDTYDEAIANLVEYGLQSNYKDSLNKRLWKDLVSDSDKSFITLHNYYFGETDSCAARYNDMVIKHWFDYIQSCKFTNNDVQVAFFPLERELNESSSSYSLPLSGVNDYTAENRIRGFLDSGLGAENTKRLAEHILKNENGVFVDTSSGNTNSTTEKSLFELLEDYGFIVPEPWHPEAHEDRHFRNESYGPRLLVYGQSNTIGKWGESTMRISGFDGQAENGYYLSSGKLYSALPQYDDYMYYSDDYSHQMEIFCIFYFFKPAPVQIDNEMDFESFILSAAAGRDYYNTKVYLNCDIDLSGIKYSELWAGLSEGSYNRGFRGDFKGNNHTIYNLTDTGDSHGAGLFRSLGDAAWISDLNFENVSLNVPGNINAGALAARVNVQGSSGEHIDVDNVHVNSGSITGGANAGGLVGCFTGGYLDFWNCSNAASVKAYGLAGGLTASFQDSGRCWLCQNHGDVSSDTESAGGIVGYVCNIGITVESCKNDGTVSAAKNAGGIIGDDESWGVQIKSCRNDGHIDSAANGGGIIGWMGGNSNNVTQSVNSAQVNGKESAGGIIASDATGYQSKIQDCENQGVIICQASRGQIVGRKTNDNPTSIENCKENGGAMAACFFAGGSLWMILAMAAVVIAAIVIVIVKKGCQKR